MREALVQRIWSRVLSWQILVLLWKPPALLKHFPVHTREADDVFEALELSHDQSAVRPRTSIADVEMVSSLLGWELRIWLVGDEVTECGLLAFELAGALVGPVQDVLVFLRIMSVQESSITHIGTYRHICKPANTKTSNLWCLKSTRVANVR